MHVNTPELPISVTTTTQAVAYLQQGKDMWLKNLGTSHCYVKSGDSTVTATTSDTCILAGAVIPYQKQNNDTHIAVIGDGATTLRVQVG